MPSAGRLGDKALIPADAHSCPRCPHTGTGPAIAGSPNVNINGRPALRVNDVGIHAACCGANQWQAIKGAPAVFINGKAAHRRGDAERHCGGVGRLIEGSSDVNIGDQGGGSGTRLTQRDALRVLAVVKNPVAAISTLLKAGAIAGLNRLGLRLLGSRWLKILGLAIAAWKVLRHVPGIGKYLRMIETFASNFFDTLGLYLGGDLPGFFDAPPGNIDCPGRLPESSGFILLDDGGSQGFLHLPERADVTYPLRWVLEEFAPLVYSFADDTPAVTIDELVAHSLGWVGGDLVKDKDLEKLLPDNPKNEDKIYSPPGPGEPSPSVLRLDLDNSYAQDPRRPVPSGPYLSAWKVSDRLVQVEVGFLRAVSFLGHPDPRRALVFEHEGDGERVYIYLQIDCVSGTDRTDQLPQLGKARVLCVVGTGHKHKRKYCWDRLHFEQGSHVRVTIARGSHATSIASGPMPSSPGILGIMNSDCYAGPQISGSRASTQHVIADEAHAGLLYQHWDNEKQRQTVRPFWGKDRVVSDNYQEWMPGPHLTQEVPGPADLLPVIPAPSRCPRGGPCPTTARCSARREPQRPPSAPAPSKRQYRRLAAEIDNLKR